MRPGFNWRTGKSDPSQIVDPKSQYVRPANQRLYRNSILTDRGARSRRMYGRNVMLPNQWNLRPDRPQVPILWRAPPEFDETIFQVTERIDELAAQYVLSLQRTVAAAPGTSNAAGDERGTSQARTNTLLPVPIVPEPRRSQRTQARMPVYADQSSSSGTERSESSPKSSASSSSEPSAGSESCFSERSESLADSRQRPTRNRQMTESDRALLMQMRSQIFPSEDSSDSSRDNLDEGSDSANQNI